MHSEFVTFDVLGIPISAVDLDSAASAIARWKEDDQGRAVGARDVASLMAMQANLDLTSVSRRAAMNVPDGMPLVWIGKRRGLDVERVCGPDLIEKVILDSGQTGLKHFFYGGKEGVAKTLARQFADRAPGVEIVGTCSPPFRSLTPKEDEQVVDQIRKSGADVVWVGISSPKQDIWMDAHIDSLPVTMVGVGAAFDFHSGAVRRAPAWMQKSGFEWLHRLMSEPRRLWRRYLVLAPKFVLLLARDWGRARKRK